MALIAPLLAVFLLTLAMLIGLCIVAGLVLYWIHRRYWQRQGIPGPALRLFDGIGVDMDVGKLAEWTQRYGETYGIQQGWRNVLVTSDRRLLQSVVERSDCFQARNLANSETGRSHIFNAHDTSAWKQLRLDTIQAFSKRSIRELLLLLEEIIHCVMEAVPKNVEVDIHPHMLAINSRLLRAIAGDDSFDPADSVKSHLPKPPSIKSGRPKWLNWVATTLPWLLPPSATSIVRWLLPKEERPDPFSLIYEAIHGRGNGGMGPVSSHFTSKMQQILYEGKMRSVGFDTVSFALTCVLHYVAMYPDLQCSMQEEVDQLFADSTDGRLGYESLAKMRWVDAVFKETLRLHPIVAFANARLCTSACSLTDCSGRLVHIEAGMVVQPDVCSIHRSKELWGDDAEEFRPQRWLNTDASSPTRGLAQQQWLAFGVGARRCLGERLAYAEAKLVLAVLLHSYVIEKSGRSEVGWTSLGSPQRGLASSVFQPQLRLFGPNVLSPRLLFLVVKER